MKRALIISPTPSHPADQGNRIRVTQMGDALKARGFIVDFFYYAIDGLEQASVDAMRRAWNALHCVGADGFVARQRFAENWGLDDWISPSALQGVRRLAATYSYDLVLCNYVWCSGLLEPFADGKAKLIIDTHDAFGDRILKIREAGLKHLWYHTTTAEEGRGLDRADVVLAIQDEEGRAFRQYTRTPVSVVEFAMPVVKLDQPSGGKIRVGYFGSGNPWNVQSIRAFDAHLAALPDIADFQKRFEFLLYGGICRAPVTYDVFRPLGMVEQARHFYEDVDIVINPMIGGTGLKIKTVEALAFGRAILSTRAGGAGLEDIHPDICLDDIEALVTRLWQITDREVVAQLAEDMQRKYRTYHRDIERKIDKVLGSLGLSMFGPALRL
jgi:glycosyltransferase involved in cell wall biosynthesis